MLVYRFYQPQNFFKKSQKKLDFLPKNAKIRIQKSRFTEKFSGFFYLSGADFFLISTLHFAQSCEEN